MLEAREDRLKEVAKVYKGVNVSVMIAAVTIPNMPKTRVRYLEALRTAMTELSAEDMQSLLRHNDEEVKNETLE